MIITRTTTRASPQSQYRRHEACWRMAERRELTEDLEDEFLGGRGSM
jgi:hypothetical protein